MHFKDKNTGEVVIVEEQARIVRRIFDLYLSGYGIKAIAKILNADGIKSQGYYQKKLLGKDIGGLTQQIAAIRDYDATIKKRKAELKASADLIDKIIADGAISDEHLRMLVDLIVVHETDGRLNVAIFLKAPFRRDMDFYDNHSAITDKAFEL